MYVCMYVYIYTTFWKIDSSISGLLGCFHLLTILNSAAMNMGTQVPVQVPAFNSFWYISRNGIVSSYGNFIFIF